MGGLKMERKQVEELILMMQAAYPQMFLSNEVGKSQMRLWRDFFLQWDYERTKKNLLAHIESSPYNPKISDIKPQVTKPQGNNYIEDWSEFEDMLE